LGRPGKHKVGNGDTGSYVGKCDIPDAQAEEEVKNLKRAANQEDPIPEVKRFCVDEAVKQLVCLNKEKRLYVKREASK
jgi:hypothetical protein